MFSQTSEIVSFPFYLYKQVGWGVVLGRVSKYYKVFMKDSCSIVYLYTYTHSLNAQYI